jgi:hypothetical protein
VLLRALKEGGGRDAASSRGRSNRWLQQQQSKSASSVIASGAENGD